MGKREFRAGWRCIAACLWAAQAFGETPPSAAPDGYGVAYPISSYGVSVNSAAYRRVAVFPFQDAPNAPASGKEVQDLVIRVLLESGLDVVAKGQLSALGQEGASPGQPDDGGATAIGRGLGAQAVVVGRVIEFREERREVPFHRVDQGAVRVYRGPEERSEATVALTLRVLDAQTAELLYCATSKPGEALASPREAVAEALLRGMVNRWLSSAP